MHIGFRTSGGRGEYEFVGGLAGQSASGLDGWELAFRWPDGIVRNTNLWQDPGGSGKPRLRSVAKVPFQVGRQVAAILLLPPPTRDRAALGSISEVARSKAYIIQKIGFGRDTEFASPPDLITATPSYLEIRNQYDACFISISDRWHSISRILDHIQDYPVDLSNILTRYKHILDSGEAIDADLERLGFTLRTSLSAHFRHYLSVSDPLMELEQIADIVHEANPALPPPDELGEDEFDIKARSAQMYRLQRSRGAAATRFSHAVREAYHHRCAFCGIQLGAVHGVPSGIDAAHILAWSSYDLDIIPNGIALCKNHHWAFDAAIMVPMFHHNQLTVRFTKLSQSLPNDTLASLGSDGFVIPDEWLPDTLQERVREKYLLRLYDDLAIAF